MPDLSKAEVERRLEAIRINAGTVLTLDQTAQTDALQTALSLYARAEAAEQELQRQIKRAETFEQATAFDDRKFEELERERDALRAEAREALDKALWWTPIQINQGPVWERDRNALIELLEQALAKITEVLG